ncbi:hypothetical protein D3C78_1784270 [compost metagenome]
MQGADLCAHSNKFFARLGPLLLRQRLGPLAHHFGQGLRGHFLEAADFPFGQVVGNRPQGHDVVQVPEEAGHSTTLAVADLLVHARSGVVEGVQPFVGWVVGALQV